MEEGATSETQRTPIPFTLIDSFQHGSSASDPLFLANSDHPGAQLVSATFNGSTFLNWSRGMKMALGAKLKLGFISGECEKPAQNSVDFSRWVRADFMVRCWLINSMTTNISDSFMYVESAKQLWDELSQRFAQSNAPLIYQLKRDLANLRQENTNVVDHYNNMKKFWDEIKSLEPLPVCECGVLKTCTCNLMKKITDMEERNQMMQFLISLNEHFDGLRSQVLGTEPLPTLFRVNYLAQQCKRQRMVSISIQNRHDPSAMAESRSQWQNSQPAQTTNAKKDAKKEKSNKKCDFYQMKGHGSDTCFRLHGYPDWFKGVKKPGQRVAANVGANNPLDEQDDMTRIATSSGRNKGENGAQSSSTQMASMFEEFCRMMKARESGGANNADYARANSSFAGKSAYSYALHVNFEPSASEWIVDTGATDHMCWNEHMFSTLRELDKSIVVGLPDGSVKKVIKSGLK